MDLGYDRALAGGWQLALDAYLDRYGYEGWYPLDYGAALGVVVNLHLLATKLPRGVEVGLGIYNAFDAARVDPAAEEHLQAVLPRDGRDFRLRLSLPF